MKLIEKRDEEMIESIKKKKKKKKKREKEKGS